MDVQLAAEAAIRGPGPTPVALNVNDETLVVEVEPRVSLLDALREHLAPDRDQEGLRPGHLRRLHGAGSTAAACSRA